MLVGLDLCAAAGAVACERVARDDEIFVRLRARCPSRHHAHT